MASESASDMESVYTKLLSQIKSEMINGISGGGSIINIINDYDWAINRSTPAQNLIPHVYVTEYRVDKTSLANFLSYVANGYTTAVAGKKGSNPDDTLNNFIKSNATLLEPYYALYAAKSDENCLKYVFPYFENDFISLTNTWGEQSDTENVVSSFFKDKAFLGEGYAAAVQEIQGLWDSFGNDKDGAEKNGIYLERPKYFNYTADGEKLSTSFILYNNIGHANNSSKDIEWVKNYKFIRGFAFKNLPFKTSGFKYMTPALYTLQVPGSKFLLLAYVSSFNATMLGMKHFLNHSDFGGKILVPEAWMVNIEFTSLIYKSANLLRAATQDKINISTQ